MTSEATFEVATTPILDSSIDAPSNIRFLRQYLAAISASLGAFCAGTTLAWTSPALEALLNPTNTSPGFTITQDSTGFVGSTVTLGALASALPSGYLVNKYGRKPVILAQSLLFVINWIFIILAKDLGAVITARVIAGLAVGASCVSIPMYLIEIANNNNRALLGSFFNTFLAAGIFFTYLLGTYVNWLVLAIILAIISSIFGISCYFITESPTYLINNNQLDRARAVLAILHGTNYNAFTINYQQSKINGLKAILMQKAYFKTTVYAILVIAFQQLCGLNAIFFYAVQIFKEADTQLSADWCANILGLTQVIVACGSIFIIEKADRKIFLIISSFGMMLSLALLAVFLHLKSIYSSNAVAEFNFIPVMSAVLFVIAFSIGYGPIPFVLAHEMLSAEIKNVAIGIAVVVNWAMAFLVTHFFPIVAYKLGAYVAFYFFAGLMVIATGFVYFFVPETRGKNSAEIAENLE